eukprot:6820732-Alexandrium_andersonii.AAC.1
MSASLVGSEMCIRDRSTCMIWHVATHSKNPVGKGPNFGAGPRGAEMGPVSYTHLTLPTICSV